jgi:polyisoprenyl-teichoic acid--peptidoglycan teichoic acid transferase
VGVVATTQGGQKRRKRPNYWLRRMMVLLVVLLPVIAWRSWGVVQEAIPITPEAPAPRVVKEKPTYVAVIGVDEREHDTGRSDTLVLVRLDPGTESVTAVNIPRDTRITHSDGSHSKINAAYATGGAAQTTRVLSNLLGIEQPYYVIVNFKAFEELVDLVDGVELTVEKHYQYEDPFQDLYIDIPAGRQTLDGRTALHFVRLRYDGVTNSDLARIERQQQFLKAFLARMPSNWIRIPDMIRTLRGHVRTNIPEADQLNLARALWNARNQVAMQTLPGTEPEPPDQTGDWLLNPSLWNEVKRKWASPSPNPTP